MKPIIYIALLLYSATVWGQSLKTTTIQLSTGDCRADKLYSWPGADTITFHKLPEETRASRTISRKYGQRTLQIDNIETGNYKLIYKNNYGQRVTTLITLTDQPVNEIKLCPDKLLEHPQNTLAKLQNKDTITIRYNSQGCFSAHALQLIITKENDQFIARLYNAAVDYKTVKRKTKKVFTTIDLLKTTTLTDQHIQDFIRFENELNYAKDTRCTTTDWYEVRSPYLNTDKIDGSCSWNGITYLKKSLFGTEEYTTGTTPPAAIHQRP